MYLRKLLIIVAVIILSVTATLTFAEFSNPGTQDKSYEQIWNKVEKLDEAGKPKSALKYIDQIKDKALQEDNQPQYLKSVVFEIRMKQQFMEDPLKEAVTIIRGSFEQTDNKLSEAFLHSLLANYYNFFKKRHAHKIKNRTELAADTIKDIEQWTNKKLTKEIINEYQRSLKHEDLLVNTPIEDFKIIIRQPEEQKKYLKTVYDLLASSALDYYTNQDNNLVQAGTALELKDSQYFKVGKEFSEFNMPQNSDDFAALSLNLYQRLFKLHKDDQDPLLKVKLDIERLQYVKDKSRRKDADKLYRFALENLLEQNQNHKVSARIQYKLAEYWNNQGEKYDPLKDDDHKMDKVKALNYCQDAIEAFPDSYGAKRCKALKSSLEEIEISIKQENAAIPKEPSIAKIDYANMAKVFFRIYKLKPDNYAQWNYDQNRNKMLRKIKESEPEKKWMLELPDDGDLQKHSAEIKIPEMDQGYYMLVASSDENFNEESTLIKYSDFFATNLKVYIRSGEDNSIEGYVLNRKTGKAIKDAQMNFFEFDHKYRINNSEKTLSKSLTSGKDGFFQFNTPDKYKRYALEVEKGEDYFVLPKAIYNRGYHFQRKTPENITTQLFTDRSIYRPGQIVHFKGLVFASKGKDSKIKSDHETTITLYDANNEMVKEKSLTTNQYGSFNGSFVLPSSGLTGKFRLRTPNGAQTIRVEEYKRPRFEVELQKVDQEFRLGDRVVMRGEAKAYAGNKISGAKVSYEVVRKPKYIPWGYTYGYHRPPSSDGTTTIETGELETDEDGNFEIKFTAIPGEKAGERFNSVFRYEVIADVTDINGETRSDSRTVSAGEKALHLNVNVPEKVDQTESMIYQISTTNLDGADIPAEGTLKIERLQQPERLLKKRAWDQPDKHVLDEKEFEDNFPHEQYKSELDKRKWKTDKEVFQCNFNTEKSDTLTMNCAADWKEGVYKLTMTSEDTFGEKVEKEKFFSLYNPETNNMPEKTFFWTEIDKNTAEPGETVNVILGSAADNADIYFSYEMNGKILDKEKLTLSGEKEKIAIPVKEKWRGGFFIYLMMNKEGVFYHKKYKVDVPYSNKKLETQLVTFRDKLKPGSQEEWKIKLKGPEGEKVAAEVLASMYDASLDQFLPHKWNFNYLSRNYPGLRIFTSQDRLIQQAADLVYHRKNIQVPKDAAREQLIWEMLNRYSYGGHRGSRSDMAVMQEAESNIETVDDELSLVDRDEPKKVTDSTTDQSDEQETQKIDVRSDFSETAFFYPDLTTNEEGEILLSFTMPESVTRWNFMTMAHTKDLKYDLMTESVQTQKELMVMPNMPRFLRESDTISVSSKISNLTDDTLSGTAELTLYNPENMQDISEKFELEEEQRIFSIKEDGNGSVSWDIVVPEGYSAVTWRITAETDKHSDGEEALLPVLTNRKLVTESMPMSVRPDKTKDYNFEKLLSSGSSNTLKHHRYTLEVTQNPAWYAVQALPYLAEFPHECSEQIFSRYYANSLASTIANSSPKIKQVFDTWQDIEPDALMSKLEKNEELKSVVLSETPWVMDAKNEQEQKRRIAMLFDLNNMSNKKAKALEKLENQQLKNGGWPWFGGDYPNRYITQHIVAGMGHLGTLNVADIKKDNRLRKMLKKAIDYMDNEIREDFNRLKNNGAKLDENHLSSIHVHYLYARSFFIKQFPLEAQDKKSYQYYYGQARQYLLKQNLYLQGMIALANNRNGDKKQALSIIESIKDKALQDEEMGMYWRKNNGYYWSQAPIERQALFIEAFDEILQDKQSVEEMKLWLLKQKQTQNWKTTKATADAVYALLLRGTDLLSTGNSVKITAGNETIDPEADTSIDTEAGTGYFKKTWTDVAPEMGNVSFENNGKNVAWGAVYWQYFEQLDKISGHDTPLSISKDMFKEVKTATGRKLKKIDRQTELKPGDRIKVRVLLSTDRNMEYVHLKDMRASGLEPVNVLSQMKYREGLRYYESTKDAATHFFFDRLPKGKYVFEYPLYVAQKGNFSNGITTVQCMYAPEFSAHSKGIRLNIR
ncbi:MAG: alpha-2-macroglobulin family protein [Bacteroidales bacterium]